MADFLVIKLEDEKAHASQAPKAMAEHIEKSAAHVEALRRAGKLQDSGRLRPSKEGKRVRKIGERIEVRDGPFAEEGRALGTYEWIHAGSLDEAVELAAKSPMLPSDELEVRPVMKGFLSGDKDALPGKLFAFGVLGNSKTEDGWVQVMDRIDAETGDHFPENTFLSGLRLEPPRTGRRIATRGERRATFDGPFLESKEVIGGLFLMRLTSIDEAVRWASETRFVVHGALEIRELWRS
ncbi:MAG: hypothetical protein JST54_11510 [Deltaproteobacteria bacterium]|nr:hypothetical protein [Deltaproteobacteria bacterium]